MQLAFARAMMASILSCLAITFTCTPTCSQDWARERVDKSPRHLEYVSITNGKRTVKAFVAYPEVKEKASAVIVIHEIFGLSDWIRSVADQLAAEGYIAVAPDLLSGSAPSGGGTPEFVSTDALRKAISSLPKEQVVSDLNATYDYVAKVPACNGKVAVAGFCWGGTQVWRHAANNEGLKAAFVFYGTGPGSKADVQAINCPVYGFYGEKDARVNATLDKSKELMKETGKIFAPVVYEGAGHGFMRAGEAPDADEAAKSAREKAWARWKELLQKL